DRYAQLRDTGRVRERALFVSPRIPSELELQARWFAGDFGKRFVSTTGDKIDIVQFGTWNREAGPDFRDAAIRINGSDPIRGCIELEAAAQFRLQQKANRIRNKIDSHGRDEALFQEIAAALGYKENKLPFTLIAQRLPLKLLHDKPDDGEAMLFGLAGFLEAPDL